MVLGASWAGARAMTSTSGPGVSLMSEFAGLAYYAEIPGVVFDIQRVGPSTGLPTRTAQGDIATTALLSHGDTKQILLIPASIEECYEMAQDAFDLAERFQQLVFVMSDLDLGMNTWMSAPFKYPERVYDRGKVLTADNVKELGAQWGRYRDVDGDGIAYRTLPATGMPSYFTRGSGHNEKGQYSERPDDYQNNVDRLARKHHTAKSAVPAPIVEDAESEIGIIGYGTSHWAIDECRAQLAEAGIKTAYMRLRGFPFSQDVEAFIARYPRIYLVEQNRDAQMKMLLRVELPAAATNHVRSVLHYNGLPIDARSLTDDILVQEGRKAADTVKPPAASRAAVVTAGREGE
jgi:2-oxoglutarate ferredoxin oxidoreductase subunit alpha